MFACYTTLRYNEPKTNLETDITNGHPEFQDQGD